MGIGRPVRDIIVSPQNVYRPLGIVGNGWAAAGMLRVLATIMHSPYNNSFTQEIASLTQWVGEIHTGMYSHLVSFLSLPFPNSNQLSTIF
jgi:hypothetical protein